MSNLVIIEKQRNLLLFSDSIKQQEFKGLYEYLQKNKTIKRQEIESNSTLKDIYSYIDGLITACQNEWVIDKKKSVNDLGSDHRKHNVSCDLCGNKPIRYENNIRNLSNNKRLTIGSDCVQEFGSEIKGSLEQARKEALKASNQQLLESKIPGIRNFIRDSKQYTETLDLILPKEMEENWNEKVREISGAYNEFINGTNEDSKAIDKMWLQKNACIGRIKKFIKDNRNKEYIANKDIFTWLLSHNEKEVIDMIREDRGFIRWRTLHRIYQVDLMKKGLKGLNDYFIDVGLQIIDMDYKTRKVNIKFESNKRYLFGNIDYKELILDYGGVLFNKKLEEVRFDNILRSAEVTDRESQDKIIDEIKESLTKYKLESVFRQDNEVVFFNGKNYYLINFEYLIAKGKKPFLKDQSDKKVDFDIIIENSSSKLKSPSQYKLHKEIKKEASKLSN